ncbi:MAG: hypothetical protein K0Q51_1166 [Rickettsiaceae bacterium]|jgi:hypothetical protein|nr:hypothetical protein [Rickettsiaceae bacterium]
MKKILLIIHSVLYILIAEALADNYYVNEDLTPNSELVALFRAFKPLLQDCSAVSKEKLEYILNDNTPASKISVYDLYKIANEKFKMPRSLKREDAKSFNQKFLPYDSNKVRRFICDLGDCETIYPKINKPIKYILIKANTINRTRKRVHFLAELVITNKIQITPAAEIVFLTGDRDLYPEEKSEEVQFFDNKYSFDKKWKAPNKLAENEHELAKIVWSQISMPQVLRDAKITFIKAGKKTSIDPKTGKTLITRPYSVDTIVKWLSDNNIKPGHCLAISNQPFVKYQELVIKRGFIHQKAHGFTVEGVGPAKAKNDYMLAIYLDNVTRNLYEIITTENLKNLRHFKN